VFEAARGQNLQDGGSPNQLWKEPSTPSSTTVMARDLAESAICNAFGSKYQSQETGTATAQWNAAAYCPLSSMAINTNDEVFLRIPSRTTIPSTVTDRVHLASLGKRWSGENPLPSCLPAKSTLDHLPRSQALLEGGDSSWYRTRFLARHSSR